MYVLYPMNSLIIDLCTCSVGDKRLIEIITYRQITTIYPYKGQLVHFRSVSVNSALNMRMAVEQVSLPLKYEGSAPALSSSLFLSLVFVLSV